MTLGFGIRQEPAKNINLPKVGGDSAAPIYIYIYIYGVCIYLYIYIYIYVCIAIPAVTTAVLRLLGLCGGLGRILRGVS